MLFKLSASDSDGCDIKGMKEEQMDIRNATVEEEYGSILMVKI